MFVLSSLRWEIPRIYPKHIEFERSFLFPFSNQQNFQIIYFCSCTKRPVHISGSEMWNSICKNHEMFGLVSLRGRIGIVAGQSHCPHCPLGALVDTRDFAPRPDVSSSDWGNCSWLQLIFKQLVTDRSFGFLLSSICLDIFPQKMSGERLTFHCYSPIFLPPEQQSSTTFEWFLEGFFVFF